MASESSCKLATSISAACEYRLRYDPSLMCSCRIGISFVTGIEFPESRFLLISGVSREGVLECPAELGERDDPDSLESRPPAIASSCSSILKEGIGGCCAALGIDLRRGELLEGLERFESTCSCMSVGGSGGKALPNGTEVVSAILRTQYCVPLTLIFARVEGIYLVSRYFTEQGRLEERNRWRGDCQHMRR
jgi:hypothetical protein